MSEAKGITEQIQEIAEMAGLQGRREGDILTYGFDLGGGRDQLLHVVPFGELGDGMHVVCFFSPCQRVKGGLLSGGLSRKAALELLRANGRLGFGHFALVELGGTEFVCVRTTQILETMEVEEFKAHCSFVAQTADAWEAKLGQDQF